jgi:hypothetical protein
MLLRNDSRLKGCRIVVESPVRPGAWGVPYLQRIAGTEDENGPSVDSPFYFYCLLIEGFNQLISFLFLL